MGRTVAAYSWQIEHIEQRLADFRRALRREDQKRLDELLRYARFHVTSGVMASFPSASDAMFWSILLEQQRKIEELEKTVSSRAAKG